MKPHSIEGPGAEQADQIEIDEMARKDSAFLPHGHKWIVNDEPQPFGAEVDVNAASLWDELMVGQDHPDRAYALLLDSEVTNATLRQRAAVLLTLPDSRYTLPYAQPKHDGIHWIYNEYHKLDQKDESSNTPTSPFSRSMRQHLADYPEVATELAHSMLYWLDEEGGDAKRKYWFNDKGDNYQTIMQTLLPIVDEETADRLFHEITQLSDDYAWAICVYRDKDIPARYKELTINTLFDAAAAEIQAPGGRSKLFNGPTDTLLNPSILTGMTDITTESTRTPTEADKERTGRIIEFFEEHMPPDKTYIHNIAVALDVARQITDEELYFQFAWRHVSAEAEGELLSIPPRDSEMVAFIETTLRAAEARGLPGAPERASNIRQLIAEREETATHISARGEVVRTLRSKLREAGKGSETGAGGLAAWVEAGISSGDWSVQTEISPELTAIWDEFTSLRVIPNYVIQDLFVDPAVTDSAFRRKLALEVTALEAQAVGAGIDGFVDLRFYYHAGHDGTAVYAKNPRLADELGAGIIHWVDMVTSGRLDDPDEQVDKYVMPIADLLPYASKEVADELFLRYKKLQDRQFWSALIYDRDGVRAPERYKDNILKGWFKDARRSLKKGETDVRTWRNGGLDELVDLTIRPVIGGATDPYVMKAAARALRFFEDNLPTEHSYVRGVYLTRDMVEWIPDEDLRFRFAWRHLCAAGNKPIFRFETDEDVAFAVRTVREAQRRGLPKADWWAERVEEALPTYNAARAAREQAQLEEAQLWADLRNA